MSAELYPSTSRGKGDHGWLKTRYSFSFADYYDPERMGFGTLRVLNDDWIAPGAGFPTHGHQNMEIITIPLSGSVAHKDDAGGVGKVTSTMVQVMSAGTGVFHSEYNASETEALSLFQIWIEPSIYGVAPRYQDESYSFSKEKTNELLLVGPKEKSDIWIHQEAYISRIFIRNNEDFLYSLKKKGNGAFIFIIEGKGQVQGTAMSDRDALELVNQDSVSIKAESNLDLLVIEVPLK